MACSIYDKHKKVTTYKYSAILFFAVTLVQKWARLYSMELPQLWLGHPEALKSQLADKACFTYIFPGHVQAWALP